MDERPTILIADDDPSIVSLIEHYLRPLDARILTAGDGDEALAVVDAEMPDVVLLDVLMPKRSGWEVCQALKALHRTSKICVVLVTAKGDVKDRLTGLQVGADDYLVKPFRREDVVSRIRNLLDGRRSRPPEPATERRKSGDGLHHFLFDRTTGLSTIPIVLGKIKEMLILQESVCLIYIDIEQIESIEAEFGWAFFEEFLRSLAEILQEETQRRFGPATIAVDRVGGSSFYVFLETCSAGEKNGSLAAAAQELREVLLRALHGRFPSMESGQIDLFVGATRIGYQPQIRLERQIYRGMQTAADLVRSAEQQRKAELTRELKQIIERKQVTTLFQPIVRATDYSVFGYEVLTRGPRRSSFTNSDMLFSFAREADLAWELEAISLDSALERLQSESLGDRKFLVNLEAEMFSMNDLRIHGIVDFFAKHRGSFVFELTERAAIEDYEEFRKLLDDFRQKGIEIAIDDAGSGYASLEAIASLAPDYLKVTKTLVSTLAGEPIKQDLVRMLVELAGRIGAKTIAEGIETAEEYEWCARLGVDLLQGYYFARPKEEFVLEVAPAVPGPL
ncbi:MAG: EAL domain-containing protein [Thermoanaerobaculia bacterium]